MHTYLNTHKFPFASASGGNNPSFFLNVYFRNDGDVCTTIFVFKLLLRPWDLSHRVERQKLMVISQDEMSVRVQKGGFVASLFLR